jgi:hypothetical protein
MAITDIRPVSTEVETPIIPDEVAAQARELDDLRAAIKVLDERQKVLRASLLDFLASEGIDSVTDGTVSVARSTHMRTGIDKARMEALYPKVLADCATETPVEQVRVKIKG